MYFLFHFLFSYFIVKLSRFHIFTLYHVSNMLTRGRGFRTLLLWTPYVTVHILIRSTTMDQFTVPTDLPRVNPFPCNAYLFFEYWFSVLTDIPCETLSPYKPGESVVDCTLYNFK